MRADDLVARLGGDEFAILLQGVPVDVAKLMAARIIEELGKPYRIEDRLVTIGACVGITRLEGGTVDDVMKRADIALYSSKATHPGSLCVFEPKMGRAVEERQSLMMDLRGALSRGEFRIEYQGLVPLGSDKFTGFEALLRWQHPISGRISPEVFVPLLEETGRIAAVGEWVLEQACRQAVNWPRRTGVAVNLSTLQFRTGALVQQVSRILGATGLDARRLQLEITESVLLEDRETNLRALEELRQLGVSIVLDDFGTGYSSLSYLRRFSFDKIKIDRSFIADIFEDESAGAIVSTVVDLARHLRVPTTAEGVETEEQYLELTRLGCTEFQGFLFSRPTPPEDLRFTLDPARH